MNRPDFVNSQYQRRASDFVPPGPTNTEIMAAVMAVKEELREFKHSMGTIETAFPRNDLGEPDFEGHRLDHTTRIKHTRQFEGLKMAATTKLVLAVVSGIGLIFVSGISVHLQKLLGGS